MSGRELCPEDILDILAINEQRPSKSIAKIFKKRLNDPTNSSILI